MVKETVNFIVAVINGDWKTAWDSAKNIIAALNNFVKDTLDAMNNVILNIFSAIKAESIQIWTRIKEAIVSKASELKDGVTKFFNELPYNIGLALGAIIRKIFEFGTQFSNWTKNDLPKIIDNVVKWFTELPGKVWTELVNIVNNMKKFGTDLLSKTQAEIPKTTSKIVDLFKELPGKLLKIGGDTIQGFINGIKAKGEEVSTAIAGIVHGVKDGLAGKKGMDTNSPSRWAFSIGEFVSLGLANGIEAKAPAVSEKAADLANRTKDAIERNLEKINNLGAGIAEALREKYARAYEKQKDDLQKSVNDQIKIIEKATDLKNRQYEKDYDNAVKAINKREAAELKALKSQMQGLGGDESNAISAIQAQIDAIDKTTEQEEKGLKEQAYQKNLNEKQMALSSAKNAEEAAKIQADISDMIAEHARQMLLEQRKDEKESLRTQIETVKTNFEKRKEALQESMNAEEERIKERYSAEREQAKETLENNKTAQKEQTTTLITAQNDRLKKLDDDYKKQISSENLNAEAKKMIIKGNNADIIALMKTYNADWLEQGKTFADKLIEGLMGKKSEVENAVNDILALTQKANSVANPGGSSDSNSSGSFTDYVVKTGDSLSAIAKQFGTTVAKIAEANGIKDANKISSGQHLRIPKFHSGGIFKAAQQAQEGLALLRDGEMIFTKTQQKRLFDIAQGNGSQAQSTQNVTVQVTFDRASLHDPSLLEYFAQVIAEKTKQAIRVPKGV